MSGSMPGSVSSPNHPSVSLSLPILLGLLLAVQLILVLLVSAGKGPLDAKRPETPLLSVSLDGVDRIEIAGPEGQAVTLQRVGEGWQLPEYFAAPVADDKLAPWLQRLVAVQRGLPIATTDGARQRFKVSEAAFERRVRLHRGEALLTSLYLGESPGLRQVYARTDRDEAVYTVRLAAHELPAEARAWLNPSLLALEADSIRELELTDGIRLRRNGESWEAEGLTADEPFDPAAAEALAMRLGGLRVEQLLGTERPDDLTGLDSVLEITARTEAGEFTWSLWQPAEREGYFLRRSDRPWYAEVAEWNAEPLIEAARPSALLRDESPDPIEPGAAEVEPGPPTERGNPSGQ